MTTTPSQNDLTRQQLEELDALLQRMLSLPNPSTVESKPLPLPQNQPAPLPPLAEHGPESWRVDRGVPAVERSPHLAALIADLPTQDVAVVAETRHDLERAETSWRPARDHVRPIPSMAEDAEIEPPSVHNDMEQLLSRMGPSVPLTPAMPYTPPVVDLAPVEFEVGDLPQFGRIALSELKTPQPEPAAEPEPLTETAIVVAEPGQAIPVVLWPVFATNWAAEGLLKLFGGESLTGRGSKWVMGVSGVLLLAAAAAWTAHGFGWVTLPIK